MADNFLISRAHSTVGGLITTPISVPYLTMPAFPAIAPGCAAVTVAKKKTLTLPAGSYGAVHVSQGATLVLSGGLYQIASLDVDQDAIVVFHAATQLRVKSSLDTAAKAKLILDQSVAGLKASQMVIYVEGVDAAGHADGADEDGDDAGAVSVKIGEQNVVQANVYAANGTVWLKSKTRQPARSSACTCASDKRRRSRWTVLSSEV